MDISSSSRRRRRRRFFFFILLSLFVTGIVLAIVLPINPTTSAPTTTSFITVPTTTSTPTVPPDQLAQWARTTNFLNASSSSISGYRAVEVGSDGSIYAAGYFGDGVPVKTCLLVKYNPNGIVQWVRTVLVGISEFYDLKIGNDGNIYVVGYFESMLTYDFGNGVTLTGSVSNGLENPMLVVYNPSGIAQWARTGTASQPNSACTFSGISIHANGNIYITGSIVPGNNTFNFGNGVSVGSSISPLLVKYNSSGIALWAKTMLSGSPSLIFEAVSVSSDENIYITGRKLDLSIAFYNFGNNVNFTTTANRISFLIKYDSTGIPQWVTHTTLYCNYFDIQVVGLDIYVVGLIDGQILYDFGNNVTVQSTNIDISSILLKFNSSGYAQWVQISNGGSGDAYFGLSVDIYQNIYAVGYLDHQYAFDYGNGVIIPAMPPSNQNHLIVKYNSFGVAQWAKTSLTNSTTPALFEGVANGLDGSIYAVGVIRGLFYDFGNNVNVTRIISGNDIVIVKYF